MSISTGVAKRVVYKVESAWGTEPSAGSAQVLRRVSSTVDLSKAMYASKELRTDYQVSDYRAGSRSVKGDIKDELSPSTFKDFIAAAMRCSSWTAGSGTTTGALTNVTSAAATPGTFTRAAGSFLTDGFKVGDIVRWTGWATTGAVNNSKNFRIAALTALIMSVSDLAGAVNTNTVGSKASGDSVTCVVVGSKVMVPQTGHVNPSFTIAHEYSDISVYELFTGCRVSSIDFNLPSTGMAEITVSFMGKDMTTSGSAYFTSPAAATTTGILAAVNGKLSYGVLGTAGEDQGIVTTLQFKVDGGMTAGTVVGSNTTPDIFAGRVTVTGTLTAYFQDNVIQGDFLNEGTPALNVVLATDNTATADFISINMPKIKLGGATRTDGEQGLTLSAPFQAILNAAGGAGINSDMSTIIFQDSTA